MVGQISCLTALPRSEQRPAKHVVDAFAIWLELNGFLCVAAGFLILLFRVGKASASYEQFRQVRLQGQTALAGCQAFLNPARMLLAPFVVLATDVGQTGIRECEIRVERDGLLEHLYCELQAELAGIAAPAKVEIISLQIFRGLAGDDLLFFRRNRDAQCLRDAAGDFILHFENVFEFAIIALSPERLAGGRIPPLGGNTPAGDRGPEAAPPHTGPASFLADPRGRERLNA